MKKFEILRSLLCGFLKFELHSKNHKQFQLFKPQSLFAVCLLLFFSCTEEIELILPLSENEIVVEGWIEQNRYPIVYLTLSVPFTSEIDSSALYDQIVSQAKVTVSCDNQSEILTLKLNDNQYPPKYYSGTEMKGVAGKRYDLKIEYKGKVVTAATTIPQPPHLDSIFFQLEEGEDVKGHLYFDFTDNAASKDYYRTFAQVKHKDKRFYPTLLNSFDDQYFNGENIRFVLYKGYKTLDDYSAENKYFLKGDTVVIKFCSVDKEHFDFWNSYQGKVLNITSFTSSFNKIKSNINGGLGVWGGYGAGYRQVIIK